MEAIFKFLAANPFILLFVTVGLAVWIGRFAVKGYGLGMVAASIVVGCALSVWASTYGVKLALDNFAKSLFYYLFMYGVGLRVGPSFINSLKGDGLKFTFLAFVSCAIGLVLVVLGVRMFDLPQGAAGGLLAGSQTMSAAIGSSEQAVTQGVLKLAEGGSVEQVSSMIALSYGISYIWGTVGIILICKYLPRWWGVDGRTAAGQYEAEHGVKSADDAGITGYRPFGLRAYRLENAQWVGKSIQDFRRENPEYRILNVRRGKELLGADPGLAFVTGDVIALGGKTESLTDKMGLIGPEMHDPQALNIPLDQAEILVTNKEVVGRELKVFQQTEIAGQLQVTRMERGGVPFPPSLDTKLERMDVLFVAGLKDAVSKLGETLGAIARPSTATDLLTLAVGMVLGFLIGAIEFPAFGSKVGLGNAGGLLVSGVIVSSIRRACVFSATRRTRPATSSRTWGWWSSSASSASTPATRSWRRSPARSRSRSSSSGSSRAACRRSWSGPSAFTCSRSTPRC